MAQESAFQHPSLYYRDLPHRYIRDPRLGHRLGRNFPDGVHEDETWGYKWLGTNANGFYGHRVDFVWGPPSVGTVRLLLLGGSVAMGLGASSRGSTISDHLQRRLEEATGSVIEVLNCAVGDYSSSQSLIYYLSELIELEPQIVIALDGWNDFAHSMWGTKYSGGSWLPNTTRSFDDNLEAVLTWDGTLPRNARRELERRRSRYRLRKQLKRSNSSDHPQVTHRISHGFAWDDPDRWSAKESAVNWYLRNIRSLASITSSNGARFFQILQPTLIWPNLNVVDESERDQVDYFEHRIPGVSLHAKHHYRMLKERFAGLQVLISSQEFRGRSGDVLVRDGTSWLSSRQASHYFDPIHFNDRGQDRVAELIAHEIINAGWI